MITPKHIARELNVPAKVVRMLLRARFGKSGKYYWTWDDKEAAKIRKWVAQSLGKNVGVK
jgi:hypothetical protein